MNDTPTQWWLAVFGDTLVWARLQVLDSGIAEVLDSDGRILRYDDETKRVVYEPVKLTPPTPYIRSFTNGPVTRLELQPSVAPWMTSLWKYQSHGFAMRMNPCPASPNSACIFRRIVPET